ncbi:MAG: hypothetical protein ACRDZO_23440 [Egibacteraceae bacterium]
MRRHEQPEIAWLMLCRSATLLFRSLQAAATSSGRLVLARAG